MKTPTLAYSELTGTIYICYGREKVDVTEQATKMVRANQQYEPITYADCANAMMKMWIDNVLTDGEYNRIMDKLNAKYKVGAKDEQHNDSPFHG